LIIVTDILAGQCKESYEIGEKYLYLIVTLTMINSVPNTRFV